MKKPSTKRFRVTFMETDCYKIVLEAKSARRAVAKAQKLWADSADGFTCFAGDTDAWDAEEE